MSHHPFSPSNHPAWRRCVCYDGTEAGEAAERGTIQHKALESLLVGRLGQPIMPLGITDDELEMVAWAEDFIKKTANGGKVFPERRVVYYEDLDDFEPLYEGTADAIVINAAGEPTCLFDYKSGADHDYYPQMAAYAAAVCQMFRVRYINVYVLFGLTRTHQYYHFDAKEAAEYAKETIKQRKAKDKKPTPCSYCKWCRHAATCPALAERAIAVSQGHPDWRLSTYDPGKITDGSEMAKALKLSRFMKAWCESVDHHAREMAVKNGEVIPGFSVAKRAGAREVTVPTKAYELCGLPLDRFLSCCTAKVTALEKLVGAKKFKEIESEFVKRKSDQYYLVEEKEKGNAENNVQ